MSIEWRDIMRFFWALIGLTLTGRAAQLTFGFPLGTRTDAVLLALGFTLLCAIRETRHVD